ncbi:MAG: cupredoxin domain-containing protein [Candidatus Binatia bacterium]
MNATKHTVKIICLLGIIGMCMTVPVRSHAAEMAPVSATQGEQVIHITAKKFAYSPSEIILKKGVPVTLELTSLDRIHGFRLLDFGIRADIKPGEVTQIRLVPQYTGRFAFSCDVFCGVDHEDMTAEIVVVD